MLVSAAQTFNYFLAAPFEFAYPLTLFNGGLRRDATQGAMEIRERETQREDVFCDARRNTDGKQDFSNLWHFYNLIIRPPPLFLFLFFCSA
jgi:hypothetical protein